MGRHAVEVAHRTLVAKTCTSCGELKDAREYNRDGRNLAYRHSRCRKCTNRYAYETASRQQEESVAGATNHRQEWTDHELARLEELRDEGMTYVRIAGELHRTLNSVLTAARRYGLTKTRRST